MITAENTKISDGGGFDRISAAMARHGMKIPPERVHIAIPGARDVLFRAISHFLSLEGKKAVWLPAYEKVAQWLTDNQGRGLFLYGNCGQGKSLLCRYVIPSILLGYAGKVVSVFDIQDMNAAPDVVLSKHILALDDIGTEEQSVKYGERRMVFAEVMDKAEKEGKLVIISTNLGKNDLEERYGDRIFDRIIATTVRVKFEGKSLRS